MSIKIFFRNLGHAIAFLFVAPSLKIGLLKSKSLYKRYISDPETILENERYEYVYKQVSKATFIANCKINVHGIEKVPHLPVMFICNHKSGFDPLLLLKIFSKQEKLVRPIFVSKKELLGEKSIGHAAQLIDTIFIDRKNIRSAINCLEEEKKALSKKSVVVFIEGTRILTKEFGEFKSAALEPAFKTMRHIVPVVIHGSIGVEKENKKGFFKYKEINIKFMTPLKYNDFIPYSREAIAEKLKNSMFDEYMKFEAKNPLNYSNKINYKKDSNEIAEDVKPKLDNLSNDKLIANTSSLNESKNIEKNDYFIEPIEKEKCSKVNQLDTRKKVILKDKKSPTKIDNKKVKLDQKNKAKNSNKQKKKQKIVKQQKDLGKISIPKHIPNRNSNSKKIPKKFDF